MTVRIRSGDFLHGFDGIADEIDHHLLDLHFVHRNRRQILRQLRAELDTCIGSADEAERDGFLDDGIQILAWRSGSRFETNPRRRLMISPARTVCSAICLAASRSISPLRTSLGLASILDDACVVQNRRQRLVELVSESGAQLACRRQAGRVQEFLLKLLNALLVALRSEISCMMPRKIRLSLNRPSPTDRYIAKVVPFFRRPTTSRPMPMIRRSLRIAIVREIIVVFRMIRRRHQHFDVLAEDFIGPIAEHALAGLVIDLDEAALRR